MLVGETSVGDDGRIAAGAVENVPEVGENRTRVSDDCSGSGSGRRCGGSASPGSGFGIGDEIGD